MTEQDFQELIRIRMGIDAMREQINKDLDAMAARVEILIPEDSTTQDGHSSDYMIKG